MSDDKLRITTLAFQRVHASDYHELSPIAVPALLSYGAEEQARMELALALSELSDEARPSTVARLLLPDGVQIEQVEVEVARTELEGRLARPHRATISVVVVPEPREAAEPAGYWVFVPAIDHACFVERGQDLHARVREELRVLPSVLALDLDGFKRLMTWAPASLAKLEVELATTPLAEATGRQARAELERRRLAEVMLASAGRRLDPPNPAPPVVGRDQELGELSRALAHALRRSVLLVGEEAAGKSALVEAWAAANAKSAQPRAVWATSVSELVAGASGLGEWQERVAGVLAAAEALDAILYFDDFGALFADRPAEGGIDIAAAIRRHVVDGRVRVIGELTPVALDRAERQDVSLIGAMLRVQVAAHDPQTTVEACRAWAAYWARTQPARPQIDPETIPIAVELARRYLPYRAFPGKAVRLLEELRVAHDADRDDEGRGKRLGDSDLHAAFSWATGVPLALLDDRRAMSRDDVIAHLRQRMVGQDAAVRRVAEAICVAKARLQPADKPLASLLFVGPTGTGKTELARSVAAYLFGAADRMVRLDMSEYTDPWAAERLFGAGNDEGRLTAAVRSQPFGVVLLDELEKAHPAVFDLLLQVLGEARLTDGRGRTTYFHNSIIVLTSNLGTRGAKARLGMGPAESRQEAEERRYRDAVMAAFRPELVNRLDQIVVFQPLEPDEIVRIAEIAIARLAERRGLTQSGVLLDISPAAIARLAEGGFSGELGARALRRHLDSELSIPAARLLARAGGEGHGGTLTVRAPGEDAGRAIGSRLGAHKGEVHVALWRRAAATGRRLVRGALALGELRRDTDRELAMPEATAVRDKIGELEATLATAMRMQDGKSALPGRELARLTTEHARLRALWDACTAGQTELRAAEELCLEALARDVDATDLIDGAIAQRQRFRRDLFWLLVALRPQYPGITVLVHSPDAHAAVTWWTQLVLHAASAHGWRGSVHLFGENRPGWPHAWGPPHTREWADKSMPTAALVRVSGVGAESLLGLEAGLHRFVGLRIMPCHVWVDLIVPQAELADEQWSTVPAPPPPRAARGTPLREIRVEDARVLARGDELDVAPSELPARLEETALVRYLSALEHRGHDCPHDEYDELWRYPPLDAPEGAT